MKLWECRYTLDCHLWTDEYVDYWYSVSGPTQVKVQRYWDKIHLDYYTVSKFCAEEVKVEKKAMVTDEGQDYEARYQSGVVDRIYKEV